jgi:putative heme-binding domain-containing protein
LEKLRELMATSNAGIQLQAVRIIAGRTDADSQGLLRQMAGDDQVSETLRAEAVAGLVTTHKMPQTAAVLQALASGPNALLAREAQRSLGLLATPLAAAAAAREPDPEAGRRLFFHPTGARCATCHAVEGRGGTVGPDLTQMGGFTPEQLLEAIREPSKDIAPAYTQWHLKLRDGREVLGIDLFDDNKSQLTLVDATGRKEKYKFADLISREPLNVSLMPTGLDTMLTAQELRDLIAYLREPRD